MPGPRRRDRRTASSRDPVEVRRLLQRDADTFIAVKRRTRASDCAAAESGQSGEGASRWWTASRIPAAGGVSPIGRISGRHNLEKYIDKKLVVEFCKLLLHLDSSAPPWVTDRLTEWELA